MVKAMTDNSPRFLGLTGATANGGRGGVWQQQLGGVGNAGEGVVIGVIDGGERFFLLLVPKHHIVCGQPWPTATQVRRRKWELLWEVQLVPESMAGAAGATTMVTVLW
jgi:hypothetical protein